MKTTVPSESPATPVPRDAIEARIDDIVTDILENIIIHSRTAFSDEEIVNCRNDLYRAVDFVRRAHEGQFRKSGEPYIFHPLNVTRDLSANHMVDRISIFASLLHDVVEDTPYTRQALLEQFGEEVVNVVDGMTKIKDKKIESFDKFFSLALKHPRILFIKIFDRLHNMRTISGLPPEKQRRISRETLDIYYKICVRLSLMDIADEMELYCNRVLYPEKVAAYEERVRELKKELRAGLDEIEERIWAIARENGLPLVSIEEYWKPYVDHYSYERMTAADAFRLRVILKERPAVYTMMGYINESFSHVRSSIYDYISVPRYNNHRSLRFEILHEGRKIPMSLTTEEYHLFNRKGMITYGFSDDAVKNMVYMRHLEAYLKEDGDFRDLDRVFAYHNPEEITVISKDGAPFDMERVSTALDFAFKIHTEIGLRAVSAVIDGKLVPLETRLSDGDQIIVNTAPEPVVTPAYLDKCMTLRAKRLVTGYLNRQSRRAVAAYARSFLEQTLFRYQVDVDEFWYRFEHRYSERERELLLLGILEDKRRCDRLLVDMRVISEKRIRDITQMEQNFLNRLGAWFSSRPRTQFLRVPYLDSSVAHCPVCVPVTKDSCTGLLQDNRIVIHRTGCALIKAVEPERLFPLKWKSGDETEKTLSVTIRTRPEYGVDNRIASAVNKARAEMLAFMGRSGEDGQVYDLKLQGMSSERLSRLLERLREIKAIREIRL